MKKQFLNFVLGAMTIVSTCGVAEAQYYQPSSGYSPIGVAACSNAESYSRQDCMESIRGVWFDQNLEGFCAYKVEKYDIKHCLEASANKRYDLAEIRMCAREEKYNRSGCLERFGTRTMGRPSTEVVVVTDALDQIIIDLIRDYFGTSADSSGEVCDVQNSTGRSLGTVSRAEFRSVAQRFARNQNSCVVTSIKDERSSRELISPNGRILGQELTEKRTSELKDRNGFERCRILTCVSQYRQVRRPRIQEYDRYDTNQGNYNGGVVHESWFGVK